MTPAEEIEYIEKTLKEQRPKELYKNNLNPEAMSLAQKKKLKSRLK